VNLTAVQLRTNRPQGQIVYGEPYAVDRGARGPVALFAPGSLVAYQVQIDRARRLFIFRTLLVDDRLAATVPGVSPRVQLLVQLRSRARVRLVRQLFADLLALGGTPMALSDAFFLRLGATLDGRVPPYALLHALLRREPVSRRSAPSDAGASPS
jgi:hypothetical protein